MRLHPNDEKAICDAYLEAVQLREAAESIYRRVEADRKTLNASHTALSADEARHMKAAGIMQERAAWLEKRVADLLKLTKRAKP